MEIDQLTDEQVHNLTPEQIELLEKDPSKLDEILAQQDAAGKATPSKQEEQDAANGADDEDEPVVLTKNGKGVIPYANHKGLRVENATLREQLQAMQQRLDELTQQREEGGGTKDAAAEAEAIEKQMALLNEDMPDLHSILRVTREENKRTAERLAKLEREKEEIERRGQLTVAEQVAEAKDNNPDLVHWENNDPEAWNEALKQDEILRTHPKWLEKTYEERFEEVARRVKAVMPSVSKPNTPESVKATAKARLEQAPVRRPTTLSDIHGGENPKSERERAENMSTLELTQHLLKAPAHVGAAMRADLD